MSPITFKSNQELDEIYVVYTADIQGQLVLKMAFDSRRAASMYVDSVHDIVLLVSAVKLRRIHGTVDVYQRVRYHLAMLESLTAEANRELEQHGGWSCNYSEAMNEHREALDSLTPTTNNENQDG